MNINDITIETPMMVSLHETIKHWVWLEFSGGVIVGNSREGKTWSIKALSSKIVSRLNEHINVIRIQFGDRDTQSIRDVFEHIARRAGKLDIRKTDTATALLVFCINAFTEASKSNQYNQVILIVDEAQVLSIRQLGAFAELFNELDDIGVHLSIFFVANTQRFQPLASQLLEPKNTYLRDRFFHNLYKFEGIKSLSELKSCLACYDNYIVENNISLVEHYCPDLVKDGVKLADFAEPLWIQFDESYAQPQNLQAWGMKYFTNTMSAIIRDYLPRYWKKHGFDGMEGIIEQSLMAAGIKPQLESIIR